MSYKYIKSIEKLSNVVFIAAWSGWSDAAESATKSLKEIINQTNAKKFASIDSEKYYVYSENRPYVSNTNNGDRKLSWPKNEFYYYKSKGKNDIIFFLGTEPNLMWNEYIKLLMQVITDNSAELVINVGSLLSSVPHTRPTRVTASMLTKNEKYLDLDYPKPNYEGPAGITSVLSDYCSSRNIPSISIWGHAPHYLQIPHNPTLTLNILKEISKVIDIDIDYSDIQKDSQNFNDNLQNALSDQNDIQKYVEKLEERYDSEEEVKLNPEPKIIIDELENFLRDQRGQ
ncbi:MAG: PAC2 family protein [Dehalococcoidia bacterium]